MKAMIFQVHTTDQREQLQQSTSQDDTWQTLKTTILTRPLLQKERVAITNEEYLILQQ